VTYYSNQARPVQVGGQTFTEVKSCHCIGPQNMQPLCPCAMKGVFERDGRWIKPEVDLGPVYNSKEQ